jgi:glycosyltransferase involved in cell wall biosynthesis
MLTPILLSLLMPTRNRSEYLPAGVKYFLNSPREDIELIVCDASDNHIQCLNILAPWLNDTRLQIIDNSVSTTGNLSSMTENWSYALDAARGEWICIIGDDDVLDPNIILFIESLEKIAPNIPAISWHTAHFDLDISTPRAAKVPIGNQIMAVAGRESVIKQSTWPNLKKPPTSLASPYHGAVRLSILKQIKEQRNGKWFNFKIPDYDHGWTVSYISERFILSERPFSITGVSQKSNSYSVRNHSKCVEYLDNWSKESKTMDGWGETNNSFLFTLPMTCLGFRNAFCQFNGISSQVQLENFVGTLKNSLMSQEDEVSFTRHKYQCIEWLQKNFAQDFGISELSFILRSSDSISGVVGQKILMSNTLFDGDIYKFATTAFGIVRPVRFLFDNVST